MLLKSINYNDFRPFIGNQKINFKCSKEKNVIVILGNNTHGKSTLVLSFLWCFYGESKFEMPNDLLNKTVEQKMIPNETKKASVTVELEHDKINYIITRENTYIKRINNQLSISSESFSILYIDKNGETKKVGTTELKQTINAIIPKELMGYFFFEGEKSNNLSTKQIGEAVKNLVGLNTLSKILTHLHGDTQKVSSDSVMGMFEKAQNNTGNVSANDAYQKKINAEISLKQIVDRNKEIQDQISEYEIKIDEVNEILRDYAPTKNLQQKRDTLQNDTLREEEAERDTLNRYLADFNNNSFALWLTPLFKRAKERLGQMNLDEKAGIKGIEATAIKELLKRNECLCGTELREGSLAYKTVEQYIEVLPPVNIGVSIRDMFDSIEEYIDGMQRYKNKIKVDNKALQYSINRINELEREEVATSEELKHVTKINNRQYEEDLAQWKLRLNRLREERDSNIRKETSLESAISTAMANYSKYKDLSRKNKKNQLYYDYAESIYTWVNESYITKENALRERLNTIVVELYNKMYSGKRDAEIDSSYNIKVTVDGKTLPDTGGTTVIKYFSFVGGLIKLAGEILQERNNETEVYGEEYPLVLDAAFSHADEGHVKSISEQLSKVTNQLVFAVMKKDWNYVEDGIRNRISRVYKLNKINEQEVIIEEVV